MKTLIELIKEQNASSVVSSITTSLQKKAISAIKEERKIVAAQTYGTQGDNVSHDNIFTVR